MYELLKRPNTKWALLVLTLATIVMSGLAQTYWNLALLDKISSPELARAQLVDMTIVQKSAHIWFTATLDVVFPVVLGGLLASIALQSFEKTGWLLALIPLMAIPVDLLEGAVQILALSDISDLLDLKAFITPLKMALFIGGVIIALIAAAKWLVSTIRLRC